MKYDKNHALLECAIPGLPQKSGKVRDVFDLGDKLLMVVTDRISAFDVILPCGVPDKGKVLNQLSLFWMEFLGMKNHLITADVEAYPALRAAADAALDRGAARICVWGEKVTRMLSSLLDRYLREGEAMLEGQEVWVCATCGFIWIGENPPELCPVCKVPAWKFEKAEGGVRA